MSREQPREKTVNEGSPSADSDAKLTRDRSPDVRREGEGMTEFTMRRIRNEHIEECAMVAEHSIPSIQTHYGEAETVGAHIAARRIRELKR